jgi:hypothetical protein
MTQQPYYPPQYPQAPQPQQPYPAQQFPVPPAPYAPPQQYPPAAPQGYPQAPQQPAVPLAQGSLDDFYAQPSASSGPSISWTDKNTQQPKPIGTTYAGVVARDVTHSDVQQQTDIKTGQPLFYRDGRPKFAMKVPLKVQPSPEFPQGEATWFVKGQARDELVRAMTEAGVADGKVRGGDVIQVILVQRRPSGAGMNPANIVQVRYQAANRQALAQEQAQQGTVAPSPAPVPQQPLPAQTAVPGQPLPEVPQAAYAPNAQPIPPVQQPQFQPPIQPGVAPAAEAQAQQQSQQAQQTAQAGLQVPEGLSPDQAALLARLTGGQPAA